MIGSLCRWLRDQWSKEAFRRLVFSSWSSDCFLLSVSICCVPWDLTDSKILVVALSRRRERASDTLGFSSACAVPRLENASSPITCPGAGRCWRPSVPQPSALDSCLTVRTILFDFAIFYRRVSELLNHFYNTPPTRTAHAQFDVFMFVFVSRYQTEPLL